MKSESMPEAIPISLVAADSRIAHELSELPHLAQAYLEQIFGLGVDVSHSEWNLAAFPRLNVTFRTDGQVRGSMSGHGATVGEQLHDAVRRSAMDARFSGRLVKADLERISVEVWVQVGSTPISLEQRNADHPFDWGVEGVEVRSGQHSAYYKPSVAITGRYPNPADLFSGLCKKAGLQKNAWKAEECTLSRTSWRHYATSTRGVAIEYVSLRPLEEAHPSLTSMNVWAESGARFLALNQHVDGSFCYLYNPLLNREKDASHNAVRTSGCAYAMAAAAASKCLTISGERYESAERAIQSILSRKVRQRDKGSYIADAPGACKTGKLGTTALLLLALLCDGFRQAYHREIDELAKHIELSQGSDGLLRCTTDPDERTGSQINFFPGQALLAAVRLAEQGHSSFLTFLEKSFTPYRAHFRGAPTTAFAGWHVDVWSAAAQLTGNREYAAFAFEQTDWLLPLQQRNRPGTLTFGGFSKRGESPNYSSIVYTEAVARAAALAYRWGDPRWETYCSAFQAGIQFCQRLQITRSHTPFLAQPERALGAVTTSLCNFDVRSDMVQHHITLALAGLDEPQLFTSNTVTA